MCSYSAYGIFFHQAHRLSPESQVQHDDALDLLAPRRRGAQPPRTVRGWHPLLLHGICLVPFVQGLLQIKPHQQQGCSGRGDAQCY